MPAIDTQKFVKKPIYVDAVLITTDNFYEIAKWCQGEIEHEAVRPGTPVPDEKKYIKVRVHNPKNVRQTRAFIGDWLLYTERGYKVYTNKAFRASFEKVDGEVESVSSDTETKAPLFYIDPSTGFLTDVAPHEGARALRFDELMEIVLREIHSERHAERIEAAKTDKPDPINNPIVTTTEEFDHATPDQNEQMPAEPAGVVDTSIPVSPTEVPATPVVPGPAPYVISRKEQHEMDPDELKELVKAGDVILEEDLDS